MQADADWLVTDEKLNAALGAELRLARERAGLTRPELVARLPFKIAVPTLLNWEQGHRAISYARLLELARSLNRSAPSLLRGAIERVESIESMFVELDLRPLCEATNPRFALLRTWAESKRAATMDDAGSTVRVHHAVIRELAVMLRVHLSDLVTHLSATASFTQACGQETSPK